VLTRKQDRVVVAKVRDRLRSAIESLGKAESEPDEDANMHLNDAEGLIDEAREMMNSEVEGNEE
jgi:hypothetical protein